MKHIKLFLLSLTIVYSIPAAAQNTATTIKVQAMEMGNAFLKNDFNTFVKYMHPEIIEFAGGRDNMKTKMDSAFQAMKQFGVSFKKYSIGHPGPIIHHNNQLQTILPQSTTLSTPFGELTAETSYIVISNDNGKSWYFIDTNVYKADKLKKILPELSPNLVIPPQKKPQLKPNNQ